MLMIRLQRKGAKHHPIYRMVVSDSRKTPTSDYLDQVGFYDPHKDPPEIRVDFEKLERWQARGAKMSESVKALVRRAQRNHK